MLPERAVVQTRRADRGGSRSSACGRRPRESWLRKSLLPAGIYDDVVDQHVRCRQEALVPLEDGPDRVDRLVDLAVRGGRIGRGRLQKLPAGVRDPSVDVSQDDRGVVAQQLLVGPQPADVDEPVTRVTAYLSK